MRCRPLGVNSRICQECERPIDAGLDAPDRTNEHWCGWCGRARSEIAELIGIEAAKRKAEYVYMR